MNLIISLFLVFIYCSSNSLIAGQDNDILAAIGEEQSETDFAGFNKLTEGLIKLENDSNNNNNPKEVELTEDEIREKIKQCDYILSGALCNKDRQELETKKNKLYAKLFKLFFPENKPEPTIISNQSSYLAETINDLKRRTKGVELALKTIQKQNYPDKEKDIKLLLKTLVDLNKKLQTVLLSTN